MLHFSKWKGFFSSHITLGGLWGRSFNAPIRRGRHRASCGHGRWGGGGAGALSDILVNPKFYPSRNILRAKSKRWNKQPQQWNMRQWWLRGQSLEGQTLVTWAPPFPQASGRTRGPAAHLLPPPLSPPSSDGPLEGVSWQEKELEVLIHFKLNAKALTFRDWATRPEPHCIWWDLLNVPFGVSEALTGDGNCDIFKNKWMLAGWVYFSLWKNKA